MKDKKSKNLGLIIFVIVVFILSTLAVIYSINVISHSHDKPKALCNSMKGSYGFFTCHIWNGTEVESYDIKYKDGGIFLVKQNKEV